MTRKTRPTFALAILATLALACSDNPTASENSPLAGLTLREGTDSVGNPPPPEPTNPTPGSFHGTVLGQSEPGAGNDSLITAPRVADVVVTVFPVTGGEPGAPTLGTAEATVTTGADGKFQLPTLAGGMYVVTFNPPGSSIYGGVWVTAATSAQSNDHPWWVVLWKK
ncbi:MAG TPA: hypothetical protein VF981_03140 [Gemmatimonadaceae bacterium]